MSESELPFGDPIEDVVPDFSMRSNLLPGWLTERMMNDVWHFVFLMDNDCAVYIQAIDEVIQAADGSIWLNVVLDRKPSDELLVPAKYRGNGVYAVVERYKASIQATKIVAAYEVADT